MARRKYPRTRFFISARHAPLISVQFTKDIEDKVKPTMIELFGMKFLQSEYEGDNGMMHYDFDATEDEISLLSELLKQVYDAHIVKEIDIDLNMN